MYFEKILIMKQCCDVFSGCFLYVFLLTPSGGGLTPLSSFPCLSCSAAMEWESVKSEAVFKQPENPEGELKMQPSTPQSHGGVRLHEFVSKTVRIMSF